MLERQEGYYWVKRPNTKHEISYYSPGIPNAWSLLGYTACFQDSDFEHINEVRIKQPGELPD